MKDKLTKIIKWSPSIKLVAGILVVIFLVALLPLLRLAMYSVPYYDDYAFGIFAKNFVVLNRNISSAIEGAAYCSKTQWHCWQGTYSASFLNALMPAIWGEEYYFIGSVFLILILPLSVCILVKALIRDVLKVSWSYVISFAMIASLVTVILIHCTPHAFYWYVGGMCYVGTHSFLIILIAQWVRILQKDNKFVIALMVILSIAGSLVVAGGTFVSCLQGMVVGASILALGFLLKNKKTWLILPSFIAFLYGFYKNVSAPGNSVRAANFNGYSPVKAILMSFVEAFRHIGKFTGWMFVIVLIAIIPITIQMVKESQFKFRFPWLVFLWSVCFYATGFTPQLFALADPGPDRTLNSIKITYQLLVILNEVYITGWIVNYLKEKRNTELTGKMSWCFYPVMAVLVIAVFAANPNKAGSYSSYGAYYYIHTGEAYNFYQEYLARIDHIKNTDEMDVAVPEYGYRPWFLCPADISDNSWHEANTFMAKWYGKNSIYTVPRE